MKSHRHRGIKRGDWWVNEMPTAYGIDLLLTKVPYDIKHAAIYYQNYDAFAVYPEGDWFDGYNGGWSGIVFANNLYAACKPKKNHVLLFDQVGNTYNLYAAESERVGSWLELHYENTKPLPHLFVCPKDTVIDETAILEVKKSQDSILKFLRDTV